MGKLVGEPNQRVVEENIYVAVSKDVKGCKLNLIWAIQNSGAVPHHQRIKYVFYPSIDSVINCGQNCFDYCCILVVTEHYFSHLHCWQQFPLPFTPFTVGNNVHRNRDFINLTVGDCDKEEGEAIFRLSFFDEEKDNQFFFFSIM
ncbi:hypothetical protein K1719_006948 [Acacia pycnantha]|nr:hypothetical protein K1719_006948 [Acacia pycnantha]